ncbi:MAG: hypothetical protein ACPIOQ_59585, partial [Promethearchaeia archaeon]
MECKGSAGAAQGREEQESAEEPRDRSQGAGGKSPHTSQPAHSMLSLLRPGWCCSLVLATEDAATSTRLAPKRPNGPTSYCHKRVAVLDHVLGNTRGPGQASESRTRAVARVMLACSAQHCTHSVFWWNCSLL